MLTPKIQLEVNGERFEGWTSLSMSSGIDRGVRTFQATTATLKVGLFPGLPCRVLLDGLVLVTGYIDVVTEAYSSSSHQTTIRGRSKTADLVDCGVLPPWEDVLNVDIQKLAADYADPYGVDVVFQTQRTIPIIPKYSVRSGLTVFTVIEALCRQVRLLPMDDSEGRLVLADVGDAGRITKELVISRTGNNVPQSEMELNFSQRYSNYEVRGKTGTSSETQEENKAVTDGVIDKAISRTRNLYIKAEENVDTGAALERAKWEANVRAGRSLRVTTKINGWLDPDGNIWERNKFLTYRDEILEINKELVVVSVTLTVDGQGVVTSLTLSPLSAYTPQPVAVTETTVDEEEVTDNRAAIFRGE